MTISSGVMTALGVVGGMLGFLLTAKGQGVEGTEALSPLAWLLIGMANTGVTLAIGYLSKGGQIFKRNGVKLPPT